MSISVVRVLVTLVWVSCPGAVYAADLDTSREALWREVQSDMGEIATLLERGPLSRPVLDALRAVPRHEFVPAGRRGQAYENRPLPIGHGQTISQPLIVALMTDLLDIEPGDRVFELGTGSGYQAAVLAAMGAKVYSMEIVAPLAESAGTRLARLDYRDVRVRLGDGYHGWPEMGPFDAIIVTAAGDHIPPPLVRQLKPGGHMVIPVGERYLTQQLLLLSRDQEGGVRTRSILPVRFVPLTGDH